MFREKFLTRVMAGVALGGSALLMTSPSASAYDPDAFGHGKFKKDDCFVTGVLTVADFDVDVQITVAFDDLAAGVEAYVNLSCATPRGSAASAIVFLNTENNIFVPLEVVYPDADTAFGEISAVRAHAGKGGPHGHGHKSRDGLHFVYEGTAGISIETGANPFELEQRVDALLAQDTVPVKADGVTGSLEVRGALVQGVIGAAP